MSPNGMPCIGSSSSKTAPKPDAEADSQFLAAVAIAAPLAAVPGTHTVAQLMLSLLQMKTQCR